MALIAIALVIRNRMDSGGSTSSSGKPRLVCAPELESVCNKFRSDVDLTIEDPGKTASDLENAGDSLGIDGWLVPGPWAEMVVEARARNQKAPLLTPRPALARSQVGMAVWPDRLNAMTQFCKGAPSWKCIGDIAGKGDWAKAGGSADWGQIKIGIPDPTKSATGLAALGAATVGYFGRDPATLSSTDLDDPGFRTWLGGLANAQPDNTDLSEVLAIGPSAAAATATFEAVGTRLVAASAKKPTLTYPAPVASADVVLGTADTTAAKHLAELVTSAGLIEAGWEAATNAPTGLPSAGFLDALQDAWSSAK